MTNRLRTTIVGGGLLAILGSIGYIYASRVVDERKDAIYFQTARQISYDFEKSINEKLKEVAVAATVMSTSSKYAAQKAPLLLKKYSLFEKIGFEYKKVLNQKPRQSIKTDVIFYKDAPYITLRASAPVYNSAGKYMAELQADADFTAPSLHFDTKGYQIIAVVDSEGSRYISNPFFFSSLVEAVNIMSRQKKQHLSRYVIDKRSGLLLSAFELKSADNTHKTKIVIAKELKDIDLSSIDEIVENIILIAALLFLLLMLLLYKVFITNYSRSIGSYYEELLDELSEKDLEIQRQADVIKFMATNDPLTGLENKVSLVNKLEDLISDAKINEQKIGVVFLDLDKFKKINDVYGHEVGDILLQKVAQRLKECTHRDDLIARLSGDEFVIVETKMTNVSNTNLIEKIMLAMKRPFYIKNKDIHVTFSIGHSVLGEDGEDADTLLKNAETAMYISKDIGPNNYVSYDSSMGKVTQKRLELDKNIRNALKNEELVPYYQPKINAQTNEVIGLETLIRWKDAQKGIVYPSEFIPFCQEGDLIIDIDRYMLVHSMRQVLAWQREGISTGKLSVNVSAKKLEKANFVSELKQIILSEGFDPEYLELEILETQIMNHPKRSAIMLKELKELGVSISIDDFGTGYSSLSYLKDLPIDRIKIDRSFVVDLPYNKDSVSIVKTIIALAKNLGLDVIAEGVETKEQLDFLVAEGCVNIQGYYFSKPLSAMVCKDYLSTKTK